MPPLPYPRDNVPAMAADLERLRTGSSTFRTFSRRLCEPARHNDLSNGVVRNRTAHMKPRKSDHAPGKDQPPLTIIEGTHRSVNVPCLDARWMSRLCGILPNSTVSLKSVVPAAPVSRRSDCIEYTIRTTGGTTTTRSNRYGRRSHVAKAHNHAGSPTARFDRHGFVTYIQSETSVETR